MNLQSIGAGEYRLSCGDPQELVDLYTREILRGSLFLAGAAEDVAEGDLCSIHIEHPAGEGSLRLAGEVEQIQRSAPKGIRVRLAPVPDAVRSALEACVTELLRGGRPGPWSPEPGAAEEAPVAEVAEVAEGDRALLLQEEATGKALDGRAVQAQLKDMSLPEKIQLAIRGGKAARASLLRDPQPAIQAALVRNPRISAAEIAEIARNPGAGGEAIQLIAANPQHMADRAICLHVVSHPKAEPQLAQKYLTRLTVSQLRQLAKSDRVRANLRSAALRLLQSRSGQG